MHPNRIRVGRGVFGQDEVGVGLLDLQVVDLHALPVGLAGVGDDGQDADARADLIAGGQRAGGGPAIGLAVERVFVGASPLAAVGQPPRSSS